MSCIAGERLVEAFEGAGFGALTSEERGHLGACAVCREAASLVGAAEDLLPALRPATRRRPSMASGLAAAALLFALGALLWPGGPSPLPGQVTPSVEKELRSLVEKLGHEALDVREGASSLLDALVKREGRAALRRLLELERAAADPEIKSRLADLAHRLTAPRILWSNRAETRLGIGPTLVRGLCVFSGEGLRAIEAATGKQLWTVPQPSCWSSAVLSASSVIVPVPTGATVGVAALDAGSGRQLWHHSTADLHPTAETDRGVRFSSEVRVHEGRVYVASTSGHVLCLDAATGRRRWIVHERNGGWGFCHATFRGGSLLAIDSYTSLCAFDPGTGALRWRTAIPRLWDVAPAVDADRVFVATCPETLSSGGDDLSSECVALRVSDGAILWRKHLGARTDAPLGLARAGNVVVMQLKDSLVGLNPAEGTILWKVPGTSSRFSVATDPEGRVYVGLDHSELRVLEGASGRLLLRVDLTTLPLAAEAPKMSYGQPGPPPDLGAVARPAVEGETVALATASGLVIAFRRPFFWQE
jgi:outer membrane protein assembly factor BamB